MKLKKNIILLFCSAFILINFISYQRTERIEQSHSYLDRKIKKMTYNQTIMPLGQPLSGIGNSEYVTFASSLDIESSDLCDLVGYTIIDCASAEGEVEGEYGEIIKLYNGMIFELQDYNYNYSYSPDVVIFAKTFKIEGKDYVFYKLAIEDYIYDATRIR